MRRRASGRRVARRGGCRARKSPPGRNVPIWVRKYVLCEHLRCHVFRASAVGIGYLILVDIRFRQSEIRDFYFPFEIEQNIFEFDISEQDIILVEVIQSVEDLEHDILGLSLGQRLCFL